MMNIQKAVIAWAKMCETDLDRVTSIGWYMLLEHQVIWCQGEAAGPNHGARKAYTNRLSTWFAPKI